MARVRGLPLYARRLKAALALRDWTIQDLADSLPPEYRLSKRTLDATSAGRRPPKEWEYRVLAEHLEVPQWFLERGLDPEVSLGGADQDAIAQALEQLTAALRPLLLHEDPPAQQPTEGSAHRRNSA